PPRSTLVPTRRSSDLRALPPGADRLPGPRRPVGGPRDADGCGRVRLSDPRPAAGPTVRDSGRPRNRQEEDAMTTSGVEQVSTKRSEEHTSELQSRFDL